MANIIKIGHIIHNFKPILGGGESYVADLIKCFSANAHHVVFQQRSEIQSPELRHVRTGKWPFKSFRKKLQFRYWRELRGLDLLFFHDLNNFLPFYAHKSIGVCHGVNWRNPGNNDARNHRIKAKAQRAYNESLSIVANDADFFQEMGKSVTHVHQCRFGEVEAGRWYIPNCVDDDLFSPGKGLPHVVNLNAVVVPRRVAPERGIELAISTFRHLYDKGLAKHLLIVGDCSDRKYSSHLMELIGQLDLLGRVFFLGRVRREQMPSLYRSAVCCLIPTANSEGTSLSALESMACGCVTFSTAVGGLNDLPTEKIPIDPVLSADRLATNWHQLKAIAEQQRDRVRSEFNFSQWVEAWQCVIDQSMRKLT